MFFKKGLRDSSLIRKLSMKNSRTSEEVLAITNKYGLAEEATINTRDQKKDKELSYSDQPSTSKNNNKKRKSDCSMENVERSRHNKEYRPWPGEFEGFLDRICIFHHQVKHKTWDWNRLQGFTGKVLKMAKKDDHEKKPEDRKGDFLKAHKEENYIYG
jgi:hypothetical protein